MKPLKGIGTGLCLTLLCLLVTAKAKADVQDSKTVVTLSAPLAVPGLGAQTLPAGTYIFKALNSSSDRDIIQISNQDGTHVFATILGVPNSRLTASDASVTMFDARPAGEPQALKAWFYPGRASGDQIVYEKPMATQLAKETNEAELSTSADLGTSSVEMLKTAPIEAVSPSGDTVAISQVVDAPVAVAPAMAVSASTDTTVPATPVTPSDTTVAATTPAASADTTVAATPATPADTTVAATPAAPADTTVAATPATPADTTVATTPAAPADTTVAATPETPADTTVAATPAATTQADTDSQTAPAVAAEPSATDAATPSAMPMATTETVATSTPTDSTEPAEPVAQSATPDTLPKTASPLPLIGLGGLLMLGAGFLMSGLLKRNA